MSATPDRIVVGIDGSPSSDAALSWAVGEAVRRDRPLHLVNALGIDMWIGATAWPEVPAGARRMLEVRVERARALAPSLAVTSEITKIGAAAALVQLSGRSDTIVLGSRGHGGLRALLGSTSAQVAAHARCPVVVVREPAPARTGRSRVVVGVDGSDVSGRAVEYAFEQASARGADLTVVHAWWLELVDGLSGSVATQRQRDDLISEQRQLVAQTLAGWREKYPELEVREHLVRARPVDALVAESEGAELAVVGSRGRGGFTGLLLGSVSHALLQHAHCPVAVVRPRPERP